MKHFLLLAEVVGSKIYTELTEPRSILQTTHIV